MIAEVGELMDLEDRCREEVGRRVDAAAADLTAEIRRRPGLLEMSEEEFFEQYKPGPDMELVEDVYRMLMDSWLLGMMHATRSAGAYDYADMSIDFGLTFEEVVEFAKGRLSMTPQQFDRLSDDLKLHAFTVGRLTQLDMIERVRQAYIKQLTSSSASLEDFLKDMYEVHGDMAGFGGYFTTVYRTNLQKDYNAGKAYQMMQDPPMYLEFVGIDDERQSEICAVRNGVIRPYTDPWWDDNWPPLHYNCRSTVREIFPEEVEARGLAPTRLPDIVDEDKEDDEGNVTRRNVPTSGFGRRPAMDNAFWGTSMSQQDRVARYLIQDEINDAAGETVCKDFTEKKKGFNLIETRRGGVRWQDGLEKDTEFKNNTQDATALANATGYYVELRAAKDIHKGNTQWDAWLNGVEKAEFKHSSSENDGTLEGLVRKGISQAGTIVLTLEKEGQIDPLYDALRKNGKNILRTRELKQLIVGLDGAYAFLTSADLKAGPAGIKQKLDGLRKSR